MPTRRAMLAGLVAVLGAVGCTGSTDFTISKHYTVDTTANKNYALTQPVDLASEAGGAWKHRSKIKSLDLVGLDATATAWVDPPPPAGTHATGNIVLKRTGWTDQLIGHWDNQYVPTTLPQSVSLTLDDASTALISDAIHGDGTFEVDLAGSTADNVKFTADVNLHLKMKYKVP